MTTLTSLVLAVFPSENILLSLRRVSLKTYILSSSFRQRKNKLEFSIFSSSPSIQSRLLYPENKKNKTRIAMLSLALSLALTFSTHILGDQATGVFIPPIYTYLLPSPFQGYETVVSNSSTHSINTITANASINALFSAAKNATYYAFDEEIYSILGGKTPDIQLIATRPSVFAYEAGAWDYDLNQVWFTSLNLARPSISILDLATNNIQTIDIPALRNINPNGGYYFNGTIYLTVDGVYRYSPSSQSVQGVISRADIVSPNGVRSDATGRYLYVTGTAAPFTTTAARTNPFLSNIIYRYTLDEECFPVNKRLVATVRSYADGLRIDDYGRIWTGEWEGMTVRRPDGKVLGVFNGEALVVGNALPPMANFALAGDKLVILALDRVYVLQLGQNVTSAAAGTQ